MEEKYEKLIYNWLISRNNFEQVLAKAFCLAHTGRKNNRKEICKKCEYSKPSDFFLKISVQKVCNE